MVEVRIRHELDLKSLPLMVVPFDRLDEVIPLIEAWGVSGEVDYDPSLSGSFVYRDREAYFEVLIHANDD